MTVCKEGIHINQDKHGTQTHIKANLQTHTGISVHFLFIPLWQAGLRRQMCDMRYDKQARFLMRMDGKACWIKQKYRRLMKADINKIKPVWLFSFFSSISCIAGY